MYGCEVLYLALISQITTKCMPLKFGKGPCGVLNSFKPSKFHEPSTCTWFRNMMLHSGVEFLHDGFRKTLGIHRVSEDEGHNPYKFIVF